MIDHDTISAFKEFPVLKTERLMLRSLEMEDADKIFEMRSSARVNQFIVRADMADRQNAKTLIENTLEAYRSKKGIAWAGQHRQNNELIGTCGFNKLDFQNHRGEIGGEMSTTYWGKKLAIEAVMEIVNYGFNALQLHSIEAKVAPENRSAIYLLNALGFKKEGHLKDYFFFNGKYHDLALYTMIK